MNILKKFYVEPTFDVSRFLFEETLYDNIKFSSTDSTEGGIGEDGGSIDGDGDDW